MAEGAKVIITGRNAEPLDKARAELGTNVDVMASDAASEQDVKTLFTSVHEKYGAMDVLYLNAGIAEFSPWDLNSEAEATVSKRPIRH